MKGKEIISAALGGTFFAIPYLGLSIALGPSLIIGAAAFGASELICSSVKEKVTLKDTNRSLYDKINKATKENKEILDLIPKVSNEEVRKNLNDIHSIVSKILDVVTKEPNKAKRIDNFLED